MGEALGNGELCAMNFQELARKGKLLLTTTVDINSRSAGVLLRFRIFCKQQPIRCIDCCAQYFESRQSRAVTVPLHHAHQEARSSSSTEDSPTRTTPLTAALRYKVNVEL